MIWDKETEGAVEALSTVYWISIYKDIVHGVSYADRCALLCANGWTKEELHAIDV